VPYLHAKIERISLLYTRRNLCGIMRDCSLFDGNLPTADVISVRLQERKFSYKILSSGKQEISLKIYAVKDKDEVVLALN
jgi:hypothetical protein